MDRRKQRRELRKKNGRKNIKGHHCVKCRNEGALVRMKGDDPICPRCESHRPRDLSRLPGRVPSPICPPRHVSGWNSSKYPDGKPFTYEVDFLDEEWGDVLEDLEELENA